MNENDIQKVYIYPIFPRVSEVTTDNRFINIEDGEMGGNHWTCFYIKDNKSFHFDSFRGQPDKFLLQQLPKPMSFQNYKIQDNNGKLCGTYCLYYFYLIEVMDF